MEKMLKGWVIWKVFILPKTAGFFSLLWLCFCGPQEMLLLLNARDSMRMEGDCAV